MPILNMIAQGSGGSGGGSNVGEPTNISASATSNSSVDITWTDNGLQALPPSTFGKSVLVRKVGSAPATPSDGTTVVTETVMNTYQSSGYTDTGLTDGTTYYYQVFSYSTDGGITYGTPVSATPQSGGWQPGVNTVAYYPLTSASTVNDMSGNSYDLTNSGAIFTNNYCEIGDSKFLYRSTVSDANFISGNMSRTYSIWVKIIGFDRIYNGYPYWQGQDSSGRVWALTISPTSYGIDNRGAGQGIQTSIYNNYTDWHLITTTYDSDLGTEYLYLDGVLQISGSQNINTSKNSLFLGKDEIYGARVNAQISDFIIENKSRTAQEISDYYNLTKGNYGIN